MRARVAIALILAGSLTSCASLTGSALYTYEDGKGCRFRVDSGRIVEGLSVKACDGSLDVTVDTLNQGNSAADFNALLQTASALARPAYVPAVPLTKPEDE